jgi:hypothetical protein
MKLIMIDGVRDVSTQLTSDLYNEFGVTEINVPYSVKCFDDMVNGQGSLETIELAEYLQYGIDDLYRNYAMNVHYNEERVMCSDDPNSMLVKYISEAYTDKRKKKKKRKVKA